MPEPKQWAGKPDAGQGCVCQPNTPHTPHTHDLSSIPPPPTTPFFPHRPHLRHQLALPLLRVGQAGGLVASQLLKLGGGVLCVCVCVCVCVWAGGT